MKNLKKFEDINEDARPSVEKKYPELDKLVDTLEKYIVDDINDKAEKVKSEMPYKSQYVLEELIKRLEAIL